VVSRLRDGENVPVICPTRLGKNSSFLEVDVRFGS
jgi:hypothetical protein